MIERDLFEQYRLNVSRFINYRGYQAFYDKGDLYVIVPIPFIEREELVEIKQMSDYLHFQKEDQVALFLPTIKQELEGNINGEKVVVYKIPRLNRRKRVSDGEDLARLHKKGRSYPYLPKSATRLGAWKPLWEMRLNQLENWWGQRVRELPANRFERLFYETFPYYLGLSENAIQFVTDCMWDDQRNEGQFGTICHIKYQPESQADAVIFPTDLTYDHPTRDLAEWIRNKFMDGMDPLEARNFLNHYDKILPLSPVSWQLLFGRLLFPLPYFEIIEGYYSTSDERTKEGFAQNFIHYLEQTESYEQFLNTFFKNVALSSRNMQIFEIEWLQGVKR